MDIRSLQISLKKENKPQLFIVSGEDEFLAKESEDSIKQAFSQDSDLDIEMHYGDQVQYEKCLESLNTLPFFSSFKMVVIKKAEKLKASFLEDVNELFESELSGLVLVLFFSKLDKRKKVIKSLIKKSQYTEVKTPYDSQVLPWISYIAKKENLKLDKASAETLNFLVGPSLIEIYNGVLKLKDSYGIGQITVEQIKEVVSKTRLDDVFKICDLLATGDLSQASLQTEASLKNGSSAIGMLSLFYRHFKILFDLLKLAQEQKSSSYYVSQKDLAAKVGVPPYFLKNYQAQAKMWSMKKLKEVFVCLESADVSLKSTRLSEQSVFSGLIVEISRVFGEKKGLRSLSESLV